MANGNAEANQQLGEGTADLAGLTEKLASRLIGGISRLAGQANRSAQRVKDADLVAVAGGGDTVAALAAAGVEDDFTYVSTAGGAFLEWLEGKTLPGVAALEN